MSAIDLLTRLRRLGVSIQTDDARLKIRAPAGVITDEIRDEIAREKDAILRILDRVGSTDADSGPELKPGSGQEPFPLSVGQERLWRLQIKSPESAAYNLPLAYRIVGHLDVPAFEEALADLVDRHPMLRTTISVVDGVPVQGTSTAPPFSLPLSDLRADAGSTSERLRTILLSEARTPFDLRSGPLLRVRLIHVSDSESVFSLVMHHIISDGWSFDVFVGELGAAYGRRLRGEAPETALVGITYGDFAAWQSEMLAGPRLERLRAYWEDRFAGDVRPVNLPLRQPSGKRGYEGHRLTTTLDRELIRELSGIASENRATLFVTLLAGYLLVLARITGQQDLVVCSPAAGRDQPELRSLIGYFNNLLGLRVSLAGNPSFVELLERVRTCVLGAFEHQDFPFQELTALPNLRRTPLTKVMFGLQDDAMAPLELEGTRVTRMPIDNGSANFDMGLLLEPSDQGLEAVLSLRSDSVSEDVGHRVLEAFRAVLGAIVRDPHQAISGFMSDLDLASTDATPDPRPGSGADTWMMDAYAEADSQAIHDPLESQLGIIWERILGIRGVGRTDDFFELGGHSLLAVQLLDEIESELGTALPLATFFEISTVGALAEALRRVGWEPPSSPLVALQTTGPGPPLFVVHSFEGHVFFFAELARELAAHHPVYGLQAQGLDGRSRPQETVEQMAETYADLIQKAHPEGPLAVVAMCFGVAVGLEVARRLYDAGRNVELFLLDGGFEKLVPESEHARAMIGAATPTGMVSRIRAVVGRLRRDGRERIRLLRAGPYARRELRMRAATVAAWHRFDPTPYAGHVTLLRCVATESDPTRSWHLTSLKRLAGSDTTVLSVPGDHFSMLRPPNVAALAQTIQGHLAELSH